MFKGFSRKASTAGAAHFGLLGLLALAFAVLCGCGRGSARTDEDPSSTSAGLSTPIGVRPPISPTKATVPANVDTQFQTSFVRPIWSVADPTVASVSAAGLVTSLRPGTTTIRVQSSGSSAPATATLVVTPATLTAIDVSPSPKVISTGQAASFKAIGTYGDQSKHLLRAATTVWSSDDVAVATVSSVGKAQAVSTGETEIVATDQITGLSGAAKLTVTGATLQRVEISQAYPRFNVAGFDTQFRATAYYSDRRRSDCTDDVVWSVSDGSVARVIAPGLVGWLASGTVTLWATDAASGQSGTDSVIVRPSDVSKVQVTPSSATISIGHTLVLEAFAVLRNGGGVVPLGPDTTWASSNDALATVSPTGVVTCLSPNAGTVTISATDNLSGLTGSAALTIVKESLTSMEVVPATASLPKGVVQPFAATAIYANHAKVDVTDQAAWTTSNRRVALVSNAEGTAGHVTAIGAGSATITATVSGHASTAAITVTKSIPTSIAISPQTTTMPDGTVAQLTATAIYDDKHAYDVTETVTWASSTSGAPVSNVSVSNATGSKGLATAVATGTAVITATDPDAKVVGTGWVTVTPAVLQSLSITPPSAAITTRMRERYRAWGTYSDGSVVELTKQVIWSSSDVGVAYFSSSTSEQGIAIPKSVGITEIVALEPTSGLHANVPLTVAPLVLVSLSIAPASASIASGTTAQFTARGTYSNGSTEDLTQAVTWSVVSGTATVSNAPGSAGLATPSGVGTSTIQAVDSLSSLSATATLTVTSATLVSLAVTPTSPSMPLGTYLQFTATGTFSDQSTQVLTNQVTWSTTNSDADVYNARGSQGLAWAAAVGSTLVVATDPSTGIQRSTALTVTAAVLTSLSITPTSATVPVGGTQQFTATGTYSDGAQQVVTSSVVWATSAPLTFTVSNASGTSGVGYALAQGTAMISAIDPTTKVQGNLVPVTMTPPPPQSILVSPASAVTPVGGSQAFVATGVYADGSTLDLTSTVTWSSSSAAVSFSAGGVAQAVAPGSATITATFPASAVTGSAQLEVIASCAASAFASPISLYGGLAAGLVFDSAGDLYAAENRNNWGITPDGPFVSKTTPQGTRTIFAGQGVFGNVTALAVDASGSTLYVADGDGYGAALGTLPPYGLNLVWKVDRHGAATRFVTGINNPTGLAFDSANNLYVASFNDRAIYKFSPAGAALGAFVTGLPASSYGLVFDASGNLYVAGAFVASSNGSQVFKVTPAGQVSVFVNAAPLTTPSSLVFDTSGNLYVSYYDSLKILQVAPNGSYIVFPGGGCAGDDAANGLAIDSLGTLYAAVNGGRTTQDPAVVTLPGIVPQTCNFSSTSSRCDGSLMQQCGANGQWATVPGCTTLACVEGACQPPLAVAAGGEHTCALLLTGTVECWGADGSGESGNIPTTTCNAGSSVADSPCAPTPGIVLGPNSANAVSPGDGFTCARLTGQVRCWGSNASGQLGNGTYLDSTTPVAIQNLFGGAVAVSAGGQHACALTSATKAPTRISCWGDNTAGQLGTGTAGGNSPTPTQVPNTYGDTAVATGAAHTCALDSASQVWCWGSNSHGQLGNGTTTDSASPVVVPNLQTAIGIAAGGNTTCALLQGGILCWGENTHGQLGNGTTVDSSTPVLVSNVPSLTSGVIGVAVGGGHACTLLSDGMVACWGDNAGGQLGNGTTVDSSVPVYASNVTNATAISLGGAHSCAVLASPVSTHQGSAIVCWGSNDHDQLGVANTLYSSTPAPVVWNP
jgi:Regulator of chromosome condensation (RCC1) repeat/Bacterial Ig-like domain (group 2)